MTDEQIKRNAEKEASKAIPIPSNRIASLTYEAIKTAYIAGAHSRDEEILKLKENVDAMKSYIEAEKACMQDEIDKMQEQLKMNAENIQKLRRPWISVKERLPEKKDGKIRSDLLLVTLGQYWTAAEYHFGDKRWINMLGERETIWPEYWQEVNLP